MIYYLNESFHNIFMIFLDELGGEGYQFISYEESPNPINDIYSFYSFLTSW